MSEWISADCLHGLILIGASLNVPIERLPSSQAGETEEERADSSRRTIQIAFAIALALLGILGIGSYLSVVRLAEDARRVAHTDEVIVNLEGLLSRATDVETGERGYAITGEDSYLEPYNSGTKEVIAILSRLKQLTVDNPLQQRRLENLSSVVAERLVTALAVIDARKSEGFEGARRQVLSGKGKELHDRIRELAHEMIATERELLDARQNRTKRTTTFTWLLILSGYTVPTICVGFALFSIRRQLAELAVTNVRLRGEITERKRAEEAVLANRAKLDAAFASMTDAVFISDAEGRFIEFNEAFATFHKFSNKTECVKTLAEYPALLEVFTANGELVPLDLWAVSRALRGETASNVEFTLRRKDTGETWVGSYNFAPIRDKGGEIVGSVVLGRDVTERKEVEEALRLSEERFRTMANSMPQLAWIAKADGYIYWYNQRWYEYTGTTPEQMEGWGWQSVHDPLVLPKVLELWNTSIATGEPFEMEFPLRRADGVYRSFLARGFPFKDPKGQIVQWFGTTTDVDELKRAEEKIRLVESEVRERAEQLRLCVEHSPTAIVMLDREMKYLVVSHRWLEAYRLGEQSIIGRSHYEVMHDIPQRWIEILQRCLQGAVEKCDEDPFLRADGRTDWVRWEVRPWRQADGAIGGIIIFSENITERKLAQAEILQLNVDLEGRVIERTTQLRAANVALDSKNIELQRVAETKDIFLANMSHELRTPLNGIIGFAEFLVDGKPGGVNPKQKEYLEDILNSGKHLLQLINDILDLAKVGAGKMEFYPEQFSLGKVIQETCAVSEPIAQKRGIRIKVAVAPETSDVMLDQQKFKQVLFNLLSNAIKFSHDGGEVGISVEPYDTDRVKLVVSDSGIGIKAEDVGRLFNEFEQLKSGASRRHEGTGLGLALTRKIVEFQGGNISVNSQLGKGSDFTVVLPLVHNQGQPTVLVVDDDPDVQELFKSFLKKFGFSRVVVGTAKDAIASLRKQKFDLIFLDLQLPDTPGDQVYKTAKDIYPDLNVVVITGYPDSEVLDRILQISPVTVLKKPLKIEQLNQTVKILGHSIAN